MSETDFLRLWDEELAEWCSTQLMKDGVEGALLGRLSEYPVAASRLVRHDAAADDYTRRKLAAVVAGYCRTLPATVLNELLESEAERDRKASDMMERLYCQSVVEDIVFAASRWCRPKGQDASALLSTPQPPRDENTAAGLAVLSKIVERTVSGESWNTASYAMTTLCRSQAPNAEQLLAGFHAFANGSPPEHPSKPSLQQERSFADGLMAKKKATLDAIESLLNEKDEAAAAVRFGGEAKKLIEDWLQAASTVT